MSNLLARRDPFDMFAPMESMFSRLFNEPLGLTTPLVEEGSLALDISETNDALIVRASLPGFSKDDVNVEVNNGVLTISGTHKEEHEEKTEKYYRRERRTGSVSRRIALPVSVAEDKAKAELVNGVLTLTLPKAHKDSPKRITVR
ncbi:MAG: Hsp20/alpha crystallin family protein [Planctomycetota bacterium]|nr:MAG: Hsp20/alpha crystallin family protein [Planctomycetota bacterium]